MNVKKILGLIFISVLTLPVLAGAQIYKWKGKDGVTSYSDTPPPVTVKSNTLGREKAKAAVPNSIEETPVKEKASRRDFNEPPPSAEEEAARMRARNAESDRVNKAEKERMAKLNKENCKAAQSNYRTFQQGGRIYKINEKGDREFYGKQGIAAAKEKAQADIKKYCK